MSTNTTASRSYKGAKDKGEWGLAMKILLIGAGMMGKAIAYDLVGRDVIEEIILADRDRSRAERISQWLSDRRGETRCRWPWKPEAVVFGRGEGSGLRGPG